MKTRYQVYIVLLAIAVPGAIYWRSQSSCARESQAPVSNVRSVAPEQEKINRQATEQFLGDQALEGYAAKSSNGMADLRLLHGFVGNALLLSKQADARHYATNEDLALLLLGKKGSREQLISASHRALNPSGQLVDRWDSPVIVHVPRAGVVELRSAGPDKTPYTEDDIEWPKRAK